ncbi:MAG: ABC transporter ATP-binding protein [Ruminococcaceae bacterium]|nr:ABC transporter ATP-binding protein [Oscillospiraceae bacterium]
MKRLLSYIKEYRKECILGPVFKMLEALLELFVPLVVASIIDNGIGRKSTEHIIWMCIVLVLFGIVGLCFSLTAQYFAAKAAVGFTAKLKHKLFSRIINLSYTELDRAGASTLITRMTADMNQIQTGINLALRLLLRSPFVVFGAMIMAFTVDVKAALIFVVAIPVLAIVVFGIMLICIPLYKKVQTRLESVVSRTRENLTGVRVLRAFCKENQEIESFNAETDNLALAQRLVGRISALMNPITYIIVNLAIIWLIYTGAIRVYTGLITQGAVVALYNYMSQILVELIKLADLIINITKSIASGKRVFAALDLPEGQEIIKSDVMSTDSLVEFRDVSLKYSGAGDYSLEHISFKAKAGQTIGIIGGTGSGKSSLINLIPRFYDASEGSVLFNGLDVRSYNPEKLREQIGVVPQKAILFKGTIADNLRFGNENATDEELFEALETAQGKEFVCAREKGLESEVEQGGKNLSGGQRQRLTIARALVKKPNVLILDDSTSALDFATDAALRAALRSLSWKPTVFIVSQRTASIMHADIILVMDDGVVVASGTHDELLENCEIYREIYDSQYERQGE